MQHRIGTTLIFALCYLVGTMAFASAARAILQGDCNDSGTVQIFKLQRCVNIFLNPPLLSHCPACDQNGDVDVDVAEVQGAANCFRDTTLPGCLMITPVAIAAPTDTPTPVPTDTAPIPTDTPTPVPTDTIPLPTDTVPPTDTPTPEPTATATEPEPTATPTEAMAVCGNDIVEDPETCDDGNMTEGCFATGCDPCPANCRIITCNTDGTMTAVDVDFQSPSNLISVTLSLRYPDGTVQIPGTGSATSVSMRATKRLRGFLSTFVDFDYLLRSVISGGSAIQGNRLFTTNFDNCESAPPGTGQDFECEVQEAVNQSFQNVEGVTCSVSFP